MNAVGRKLLLLLLAAALVLAPACVIAQREGMAHYLLIGTDGWGLSEEGGARSDAIILATLDYDRDRVVLVSFARDSLVRPAYRKGVTKLNTLVRSTEGDRSLVEYIEDAFGVPISGYFLVNFSGAVDIVNAIGGVEVNLSDEEARYLHAHTDPHPQYPLQSGSCRLNGAQALAYMRCRVLDNDFGRQRRQGSVLRAAFRELSAMEPLEALMLLDDLLGMYRTDMRVFDQVALVKDALSLRDAALETHSLPVSGTYKYSTDGNGASALLFDLAENRKQLWAWLGRQDPTDESAEQETRE